MNEAAKTSAKAGTARPSRGGPFKDLGEGASAEGRKRAAAILEVLAGVRTPTQAAEALAMTLPYYYALEARVVQAILVACEPREPGRQQTAESALAALRRECEKLRRDCTRQQALVRAAQRTIGLTAPAPPRPEKNGKRRRRRPTARALRAVARLKEEQPATSPAVAAANEAV